MRNVSGVGAEAKVKHPKCESFTVKLSTYLTKFEIWQIYKFEISQDKPAKLKNLKNHTCNGIFSPKRQKKSNQAYFTKKIFVPKNIRIITHQIQPDFL